MRLIAPLALAAAPLAALLSGVVLPTAMALDAEQVANSGLDYLNDAAGRLRRLHKSSKSDTDSTAVDDSSSSSSSSDTHDHSEELRCMLYEDQYNAQLTGGWLACPTATDSPGKCGYCSHQCDMFNATVCPEDCNSEQDAEDFCQDVDGASSGSKTGTNTGGTGGTGSSSSSKSKSKNSHSALCHMQCLHYVYHCCPCRNTVTLVSYSNDQVAGTAAAGALIVGVTSATGASRFPTFIQDPANGLVVAPLNPGEMGFIAADPLDETGAPNGVFTFTGSQAITGTLATEDPFAFMGIDGSGTLGVVFGITAAANADAGALVLWDADDFLNGVDSCAVEVESITYTTGVTLGAAPATGGPVTLDDVDIVLCDNRGCHIATAPGTSGTFDLSELSWQSFDPRTNEDDHHAGVVGGSSTPSFTCPTYVGGRLEASVGGAAVAADTMGAGFTNFQVTGKTSLYSGCLV